MKPFIFSFFTIVALSGCNNGPEETPTPPATTKANEEQILKQAAAQFPDSIALRTAIIEYYRSNEEYEKGISAVDAALLKDSSNGRLWDIKAQLHSAVNDTLNEIKAWEKAVTIRPDTKYLLALGYLYADLKNAKAIAIANGLMIADKGKLAKEALLIKGIYYSKTDKQKAISFYDEALAKSYTFMIAYREKAMALYGQEKYNDAVKVLDRAISIQHDYDEAYYWLGRCYEKLNKKDQAKQNYELAVEFAEQKDEDYPEAKEALDKLEGK